MIVLAPGLSGTCAVHDPSGATGTGCPPTMSEVIPAPALVMPATGTVGVETVLPVAGEPITIDSPWNWSWAASASALTSPSV